MDRLCALLHRSETQRIAIFIREKLKKLSPLQPLLRNKNTPYLPANTQNSSKVATTTNEETMKWIKTLSAKVISRRNDDSPGSRRRSLKRKASSPGSLTDQASLSSLATTEVRAPSSPSRGTPARDDATWKIGMYSTAKES